MRIKMEYLTVLVLRVRVSVITFSATTGVFGEML